MRSIRNEKGKKMKNIYSDGVLGVSVDGTMVHIRFANKKMDKMSETNLELEDILEPCADVSMSFLGFVQFMGVIQNLSKDEKFVDIAKRLQDASFLPKGEEVPAGKKK